MNRTSKLLSRVFQAVAIAPIVFYRRVISPLIPARCRYYPTCSSYAVSAVREFGVLRGSVLAAWRLLRCNPWSDGGVDYVADQKIFHVHGKHCGHHPSGRTQ
ncbi:MAG: membrane protein insertion efficiency factor YidD [Thermoleophilaceae bacterium]|nr:membrane protein insertion efficiency factor YidD [Thermoleophilaceae bacterium]